MLTKNAIFFSDKNIELSEEINKFCKSKKINLIYSSDFADFTFKFIEAKPEVVFCDCDTVCLNEDIFNMFLQNKNFVNTNVIMISKYEIDKVFEYKNVHYLIYDNLFDNILKIIENVDLSVRYVVPEELMREYKIKLTGLLRELGITTKHMGYNYIREIVLEIIKDDRRIVSLTKHLYPLIAIRYNTYRANIERNIRNALNFTIKNCRNKEMMQEIMTLGNAVPSNKQFITYLVEKLTEE